MGGMAVWPRLVRGVRRRPHTAVRRAGRREYTSEDHPLKEVCLVERLCEGVRGRWAVRGTVADCVSVSDERIAKSKRKAC